MNETKNQLEKLGNIFTVGAVLQDMAKRQAKPVKPKNLCGKMVKRANAYEVWQAGDWTWYVLKKWQADDNKPYARWFCDVVTPICPDGEMGDVYVSEIKGNAIRIK
jgi:hypothetical protein